MPDRTDTDLVRWIVENPPMWSLCQARSLLALIENRTTIHEDYKRDIRAHRARTAPAQDRTGGEV